MWTKTEISVAAASMLVCASAMAYSAPHDANEASASMVDTGEIRVGLAQLCAGDTPQSSRIEIPIAPSMVGRDVEPRGAGDLCTVRDTRIDITATAIDIHEDKWKVGSVKISIAPKDEAALGKAMRDNAGKKLVLLRNDNAVLEFETLLVAPRQVLNLKGFGFSDAEAIKKAIVDGT
jgi:hypothetical protein